MTMGILGHSPSYTVPAGKVAVVNIIGSMANNATQVKLTINSIPVIQGYIDNNVNTSANANFQLKGIILSAGDVVTFISCTGIVTGFEEDA